MGNDVKKWYLKKAGDDTGDVGILEDGKLIVEVFGQIGRKAVPVDAETRAAFIVRACSAHDELLTACEAALKALNELPSRLWPIGLDNRRVCPYYDAISQLLAVIAKAKKAGMGIGKSEEAT